MEIRATTGMKLLTAFIISLLLIGATCDTYTSIEDQIKHEYCPQTDMRPYDYEQALCMSYLFYEAQRSGELPEDQRVHWRRDSAMDDGSDVNRNLTGGYYDAGDFVKFGFPLAFTTTFLGWALLDFNAGQNYAGQTHYARKTIQWALDYMMEAHVNYREFYGQVGNGTVDHAWWGRPEDMTMERPSFKIDDNNPGSDLAGETAAAFAAGYLVFKHIDTNYAHKCLDLAREMFQFADDKRGTYDVSIPGAEDFYKSWSGYGDELAWSALWMYRATGEDNYLTKAKGFITEFKLIYGLSEFSWDDKKPGFFALLANITQEDSDMDFLKQYLAGIRVNGTYTPKGLLYQEEWGPLRYAVNAAYIALYAAKIGVDAEENRAWAEKQVNYALGSSGRSFVVGFGNNPPQRPHHRSSSCKDIPAPCDWNDFNSPDPNPQVLYGGMVGGPDINDTYADDRSDYQKNEVALDYNAGLSAALAGVIEFNRMP